MGRDYMHERITERDSNRKNYALRSRNDAVIQPYATYELFYEITFEVLRKLGEYEDIGTPAECREAMETAKMCEAQPTGERGNPLEPLKITSALRSEVLKMKLREENDKSSISILDYTVIAALQECLERRVKNE